MINLTIWGVFFTDDDVLAHAFMTEAKAHEWLKVANPSAKFYIKPIMVYG